MNDRIAEGMIGTLGRQYAIDIQSDTANAPYTDLKVNHPKHYQSANGIEVIDVIDAFTKDLNGVEAFNAGNVIKYICRWRHKNGLEDLNKAKWYLNHLIEHVEKKEKEND